MRIKNTLKQLVEQVTSLSNKKRVSIKYKIFIGAVLFIILNIIINLLIVKVSINDIYLALEKKDFTAASIRFEILNNLICFSMSAQ